MASIPNLNTLRTGRRGPRLRRGPGRAIPENDDSSPNTTPEDLEAARDKIVQQTDGDASNSRLSAVALDYLTDPYAAALYPQTPDPPRRYPIINRGTYVRTTAIDQLVTRFLANTPTHRKQIISLGAGSDTRFFRLCSKPSATVSQVEYHELDFEANVNAKRTALRQSETLSRQILTSERAGATYRLHALDLRDLTAKSPAQIPHFDPDLPTLLLSECCLCYLPSDTATSVLQYFTLNVKASLGLALYEPVRPNDAFGRTMVANLASRGILLQTLKRYGSLEAQRLRFKVAGLVDGQGARDVLQLWEGEEWVSREERARVEGLEWLDEVEEWKLLASHYCVAWGWKGACFTEAWGSLGGGRTKAEDVEEMMM